MLVAVGLVTGPLASEVDEPCAIAGCPDDGGPAAGSTSGEASTAASTSAPGSSGQADSSTTESAPPSRWIVTADFTAGTLTLVDYDALAAGERDPAALIVGTIDVSAYAPGAMEVEIAPDGHTAFVSITPGFFDTIVGQTLGFSDLALDGTGLSSLRRRLFLAAAGAGPGMRRRLLTAVCGYQRRR